MMATMEPEARRLLGSLLAEDGRANARLHARLHERLAVALEDTGTVAPPLPSLVHR